MARTLDDYRRKLIHKIHHAYSSEAIRRYAEVAVKSLQAHGVHEHIIVRFLEKTILALEETNYSERDNLLDGNMQTAVRYFSKLRMRFESKAVSPQEGNGLV